LCGSLANSKTWYLRSSSRLHTPRSLRQSLFDLPGGYPVVPTWLDFKESHKNFCPPKKSPNFAKIGLQTKRHKGPAAMQIKTQLATDTQPDLLTN